MTLFGFKAKKYLFSFGGDRFMGIDWGVIIITK